MNAFVRGSGGAVGDGVSAAIEDAEAPAVSASAFARNVASRLAAAEAIDGPSLARLFRYAAGPTAHAVALRHALQGDLLRRTLDHAGRHTRFYSGDARYRAWRGDDPAAAPSLSDLPVIDRATVVENHGDFIADDVALRSICHTSGTTGVPLDVYKSHEEVAFLQRYFVSLFAPVRRALRSVPLTLSFPNNYHGVPVPLPGLGMGFVGGVTDDTLIRDAHRVLAAEYRIPGADPRVSLLSGLCHHVLFFTSYLLEQGVDLRACRMSGVTVTGGHVAPHWRDFLRESWGCAVNDRFTLTESIGGASRDLDGSTFTLDPHLIGEALEFDDRAPLASGVGLLALTNLYPFVQMQPLVRYLTGDLVLRRETEAGFVFEFLGKARNCISSVRGGRREWLIFSSRLNDLLSAQADVRVYPWFSNVTAAHDRTVGSLPLVAVEAAEEAGATAIRISVELRYAPALHRRRVDDLRAALVAGLRADPHASLAARLDDGSARLDIGFLAPGQLDRPIVIKI